MDVHLNRQQAITLLRELAINDLADPSYIHICERSPNNYQLQFKTQNDRTQLNEFAEKHGLKIEETEKYLIIFKP